MNWAGVALWPPPCLPWRYYPRDSRTPALNREGVVQEESFDPSPPEQGPGEAPGLPFPVVGVGASAGGLVAYAELLTGLPAEAGLPLLLVSYLDPTHKSELAPRLGRVSRMPVLEVTEGMAVEVNRVYVIPPGTNMAMTDGHLTLKDCPLTRLGDVEVGWARTTTPATSPTTTGP